MRLYTTPELISKCRTRGGYAASNRLTDAVWLDFLESGLAELHDLLITKYGEDYFTVRAEAAITAGVAGDLPDDILKLLRVDLKYGDRWRGLRRFMLSEAEAQQEDGCRPGYRLEGGDLVIEPEPTGATAVRVIYVKSSPKLSLIDPAPAGTVFQVEGYNGWEELLVLYALLRAKRSQDEPTDGIEREIARQTQRVEYAAAARDAGEPMRIPDPDFFDHDPWGWT
jgi:hypothetical protein